MSNITTINEEYIKRKEYENYMEACMNRYSEHEEISRDISFDLFKLLNDVDYVLLTAEEKGCHLILYTYAFSNNYIPNNYKKLAKLCGITDLNRFKEIWENIGIFFEWNENGIKNINSEYDGSYHFPY